MADVYRIGVAMTMTNGVSPVLSVIARDLLHVHSRVQEVTKGLTAWKVAIYGAGAAMAGAGMLKMVGSMVKEAGKLRHEQVLLNNAIRDEGKVREATAASWKAFQTVPGSRVADNLKSISDLQQVFGNTDQAIKAMPKFQMMAQVLSNIQGKGGEEGNISYLAARAMELRGALINKDTHQIDPALFEKELDAMARVVMVSRGRVGPREFLNFIQQAGPGARILNDEAMYQMMPAVIQAMGGHRAGTAFTALNQMMIGGITTKRTVDEWMKLGLVDQSKVHVQKGGQVRIDDGAFKGYDASNPFKYLWDTLMPALKAHGFTTQESQMAEIFRLSNRQTTGRLLADVIQNMPQIQKDAALMPKTETAEGAFKNLIANDPTQVMKAFHAAWNGLITALGDPSVSSAVAVITNLSSAMRAMSSFALENPTLAATIVQTVGVIGAVLAAVGAVAVAAAAFSAAPVAAGIAAIAVAITALTAMNFDAITGFFKGLAGAISAGITMLVNALQAGQNFLGGGGAGPKANPYTGMPQQDHGPTGMVPGKQGWNASPPPRSGKGERQFADVYLDGHKVGSVISRVMADAGSGPSQGSPYHDTTRSAEPLDYAGSIG